MYLRAEHEKRRTALPPSATPLIILGLSSGRARWSGGRTGLRWDLV